MKIYRYILAAAFMAALLCIGAMAATPPDGAASYKGVDIYHGSNVLSFSALKSSGHADFAWVKSGEGEHTRDNKFTANVAGCKSSGIRWGAYHYVKFYSVESAVKQADFFWSCVKGTGYTVLPAADIEEYTYKRNTSADIRAMTAAFFNEFKRLSGFYPVLYTYTDFCNNVFPHGTGLPGIKLWLADYRGYAGDVPGWKSYEAWQYSGDKAHVAGIDNATDLDVGTANIFVQPASVKPAYPIRKIKNIALIFRAIRRSPSWSRAPYNYANIGDLYEIRGAVTKDGWVEIGVCGYSIGYISARCF